MQRFPALVVKSIINNPIHFKFAKIIKMTPNKTEEIGQDGILRSTKHATLIFSKLSTKKLQLSQKASTSQNFKTFIEFVANLNIDNFEKSVMTSRDPSLTDQLFKQIRNQKIIPNTIELLIAQKSFTPQLKQFLTNFILGTGIIIKKKIFYAQLNEIDINFLKEYMHFFNQYFTLLEISPKLIIVYLFLMNHIIATNTIDSSRAYFINQKAVFDYILDNKASFKIHKPEVGRILSYLSLANVIANYPSKYYELVQFLLSKYQENWYLKLENKNKYIIYQMYNLGYNCEKIMKGFRYIMNQQINVNNYEAVVSALTSYIQLKAQIFIGKPLPVEILHPLQRICTFIKKNKKFNNKDKEEDTQKEFKANLKQNWQCQIYKRLLPVLYRSSIWLEQIWFEFADWLDTNQNYKQMQLITLYTIFELLKIDTDIIPQSIVERLLKSKNLLLVKNNFRIEDVDLIKEYHRDYGNRMRASYTVQQQIANNLRSVSKKTVKSQSLVSCFIVDILLNDNIIVEVNNNMHYIENQDKSRVPNLKSVFRKRVLQKLGYKFWEFDLDIHTEGTLQFLKIMEKEFSQQAI